MITVKYQEIIYYVAYLHDVAYIGHIQIIEIFLIIIRDLKIRLFQINIGLDVHIL